MLIRMIIGLIFILEINATRISAQDLMPLFGEPTRTWTSEISGATDQYCGETETASHWIDGDTLIDEVIYHRVRSYIKKIEFYILGMDCNPSPIYYSGPTAFVREDSNKVFSLFNGLDHLIYDFNACTGDSIPMAFGWFNGPPESLSYRVVTSTDSVWINNTYRKRMWIYAYPDSTAIIEGIGSTTGLFNSLDHQIGLSHFVNLNCVSEQGETIYSDGSCWFATEIGEMDGSSFTLHPNPTTGIINFSDQVVYEIFDATGRFITSGRSSTADLSAEPQGLYLIRISDGGRRSHHRVILEH